MRSIKDGLKKITGIDVIAATWLGYVVYQAKIALLSEKPAKTENASIEDFRVVNNMAEQVFRSPRKINVYYSKKTQTHPLPHGVFIPSVTLFKPGIILPPPGTSSKINEMKLRHALIKLKDNDLAWDHFCRIPLPFLMFIYRMPTILQPAFIFVAGAAYVSHFAKTIFTYQRDLALEQDAKSAKP